MTQSNVSLHKSLSISSSAHHFVSTVCLSAVSPVLEYHALLFNAYLSEETCCLHLHGEKVEFSLNTPWKYIGGVENIAPAILKLRPSWRWGVSLMLQPHCPQREIPRCSWTTRLCVILRHFGCWKEEAVSYPYQDSNTGLSSPQLSHQIEYVIRTSIFRVE